MGAFGSILEQVGSILELFGSFTEPFGGISHIAVWGISHIAYRVACAIRPGQFIDLQYQLPNIDGDIYRGYIFDLEHPYISQSYAALP